MYVCLRIAFLAAHFSSRPPSVCWTATLQHTLPQHTLQHTLQRTLHHTHWRLAFAPTLGIKYTCVYIWLCVHKHVHICRDISEHACVHACMRLSCILLVYTICVHVCACVCLSLSFSLSFVRAQSISKTNINSCLIHLLIQSPTHPTHTHARTQTHVHTFPHSHRSLTLSLRAAQHGSGYLALFLVLRCDIRWCLYISFRVHTTLSYHHMYI